jgi:uncharacterized protein (DUF2237 family)
LSTSALIPHVLKPAAIIAAGFFNFAASLRYWHDILCSFRARALLLGNRLPHRSTKSRANGTDQETMEDQKRPELDESINVLGEALKSCSNKPLTGFFRDGCCNTGPTDKGRHTVCVLVTEDFLEFSKSRGNDLSTPVPEFGFAGLNPGDRWCLCADRWAEADAFGAAPMVVLESTHQDTLETIPFSVLRKNAIDMN